MSGNQTKKSFVDDEDGADAKTTDTGCWCLKKQCGKRRLARDDNLDIGRFSRHKAVHGVMQMLVLQTKAIVWMLLLLNLLLLNVNAVD